MEEKTLYERHFHVPEKEKGEVLAAFETHKNEVTTGYYEAGKKESDN